MNNAMKKKMRRLARYNRVRPNITPRKAHALVGYAVRIGILKRPHRCSRCGAKCKPHGHHPDYSRPLAVIWLCFCCHKAEHRYQSKIRS